MMHSAFSDFFIAAQIDAHYEAEAIKWEIARRVDERVAQKHQQEKETSRDSKALLTAMLVTGVSPSQKRELEERLSSHQQAVIQALQENREHLDQAEEAIDDLLGRAHVLEDGRRVFETEDGTLVYDEFGQMVSSSDITPEQIDDARPKWDTFKTATEHYERLQEQQADLLEYQDRLDAAQEVMTRGNLSQSEYEDLDNLLNDAPDAVRAHLPASDPHALVSKPEPMSSPDVESTINPMLGAQKSFF